MKSQEMTKGGSDMVVDWIWRMYNMAFESGVVPEDWRSAVIVPCTRVKEREMNVVIRYVNLLSMVAKIHAGILVDRVHNVTEGLIDDEQGGVSDQGENV